MRFWKPHLTFLKGKIAGSLVKLSFNFYSKYFTLEHLRLWQTANTCLASSFSVAILLPP